MQYDYQIIANLMSGKGESLNNLLKVEESLKRNNLTYRKLTIERPTPISQIPRDGKTHIKKGVICIGGDGTVSETVGYLINNKIDKPLAVIPTGTANIIYNTIYQNQNGRVENNITYLNNDYIPVDIGVAEYGSEKVYFLLGFGLGFEEQFLRLAKSKLKKELGIFSYIFAALSELLSLKNIPLQVKYNGKILSTQVSMLGVFNLQPKILKLFPLFKNEIIRGDDNLLDLYYVVYKNPIQSIAGILNFHLMGRKNFRSVKYLSASGFEITSSLPCLTQTDGELRGGLPVKLSLIPKGIRFFV